MTARSSGDLVADRRYEWARGYAAAGDHAAAADLYAQALEAAPDWLPALVGLGEARAAAGEADAAAAAFRRALALDPADVHGAGLKLAALGAAAAPAAPPAAYVRGLFDGYADRFDRALVEDLGYRTPWRLGALLAAVRPDARFARVLDLGCGTGLTGAVLRPAADRLEGVDLSPAMVAKARDKGDYDALAVGDVVDHLAAAERSFDLVVAADVFVYLGALDPVFAAVAARTLPGALFAFSVEAAEDPDTAFLLRDSLRYAHGGRAVAAGLAAAGFRVAAAEDGPLRLDRGVPVEGRIVVAERV
ncbi:class I SAM-dependent DNA methyltransferase [Oharaeibacter diazotrophicus]|uniref:Putative TPR repeat methyltransferase n=2 Tax=Oharaeibacter diazotrophicus TaxID=1920512 RepID=A0A4R6R9E0_9HYPH|nr:methyltransferase domain-containing protein [Oharaeibacter diazotrophicus]TDP82534.1 putative TPR repeat methyltransferase [Oharaeibacter diazotrophicus]BBE72702.1 malonyl-[acyl-carrier protein] O-methyltransferase [Pleomorphomonas sp. SM30]GLS76737.1 methyltransferase [Oharaeibacter diazotrophicus]